MSEEKKLVTVEDVDLGIGEIVSAKVTTAEPGVIVIEEKTPKGDTPGGA